MSHSRISHVWAIVLWIGVLWISMPPAMAPAIEIVTIREGEKERVLQGRTEVEAQDGGLILLAQDGRLWTLQPDQIVTRQSNSETFQPLERDKLEATILAQLPPGFQVRHTDHYLIAHNTSTAYAIWCGGLYERLHAGFQRFWKERGWKLPDSPFPLVVVLFENRQAYMAHGQREVGEAIRGVVGYYSLESNQVTTYDLTGLEEFRQDGSRPATTVLINQVLAQPAAEANVATMIHEATHQLAYNLGLQDRSGFNPLWLSEGLAIFFETPDLRNNKGWGRIGLVHRQRLLRFRQALARGTTIPLTTLLGSDDALRDPKTAADGYAESWALCFFLLKKQPDRFLNYLRDLSENPPRSPPTAEERVQRFSRHLGDLRELERQFLLYMSKLP